MKKPTNSSAFQAKEAGTRQEQNRESGASINVIGMENEGEC
jgi:hypothetical protein